MGWLSVIGRGFGYITLSPSRLRGQQERQRQEITGDGTGAVPLDTSGIPR